MISQSGKPAERYHSRRFRIPWYWELIAILAIAYANLTPLAGMFSVTRIML